MTEEQKALVLQVKQVQAAIRRSQLRKESEDRAVKRSLTSL